MIVGGRREAVMEVFLDLSAVIVWFAVVIWSAASLVAKARRTKNWEKVHVAAISAATVAGPLLIQTPDEVLLVGRTRGLGAVLALVSWIAILWAQPRVQRFFAQPW
jgi:ABC-type glucose/galactose transport system permease subunit